MSFSRLFGSFLAKFRGRGDTDPPVDAQVAQVYAKTDLSGLGPGGVQLYTRTPDGVVYRLTPSQTPLPDVFDQVGIYVGIGQTLPNNAGCKTVIGTPPFLPGPADPMLRVRTDVGVASSEQLRIEDAAGSAGHLLRKVFDATANSGYLETYKYRGTVWSYDTHNTLVPGAVAQQNDVPVDSGFNDTQQGAAITVTGFAPSAQLVGAGAALSGTLAVECFNAGTGNLTLAHENLASVDINRLRLAGGVAIAIRPGGGWRMIRCTYPGVGIRWVLTGVNA